MNSTQNPAACPPRAVSTASFLEQGYFRRGCGATWTVLEQNLHIRPATYRDRASSVIRNLWNSSGISSQSPLPFWRFNTSVPAMCLCLYCGRGMVYSTFLRERETHSKWWNNVGHSIITDQGRFMSELPAQLTEGQRIGVGELILW